MDSLGFDKGPGVWQRRGRSARVSESAPVGQATRAPRYEVGMLTPSAIKAPHGAQELEITWSDGRQTRYPHRVLRGYCPCAGCQGHAGPIKYREGGNLELRDLSTVGNYALGLVWGDGHNSGIYTYAYLLELADWLERSGEAGLVALGELPRR